MIESFSFDRFMDSIQAVTLAATSTAVTVKRGVPFFIHNTGNAVMYVGSTATLCTTPGLPIYAGQVRGPFFLEQSTSIYMRGTALQTAVVEYGNMRETGGAGPIPAGTAIIGKVGIDQTTDGTTNKVRTIEKQSNSAPTASPVTVDTTAGGTVIAAANANRISITLQNTGTEPCIIRLGGDPSASAYNFILGEDSAAKAGNGGSITIKNYTGAIKGITEANSTVIAVTEVV